MHSELDILRERGLVNAPEKTTPASPGATAAREHYQTLAEKFSRLIERIISYRSRPGAGLELSVQRLIDCCVQLAADVRTSAAALNEYPRIFFRVNSQAVFLSDIAGAAEEAYQSRISQLCDLEITVAKPSHLFSPVVVGTLLSHEAFKGGHLLRKHVAWTMKDFERRFIEEELQGTPKKALSAFIDRATAEEVVSRAIQLSRSRIEKANEGDPIKVIINELRDIGYVKERGRPPRLTKCGFLVVIKDSDHPSGYRIVTAQLGKGKN